MTADRNYGDAKEAFDGSETALRPQVEATILSLDLLTISVLNACRNVDLSNPGPDQGVCFSVSRWTPTLKSSGLCGAKVNLLTSTSAPLFQRSNAHEESNETKWRTQATAVLKPIFVVLAALFFCAWLVSTRREKATSSDLRYFPTGC